MEQDNVLFGDLRHHPARAHEPHRTLLKVLFLAAAIKDYWSDARLSSTPRLPMQPLLLILQLLCVSSDSKGLDGNGWLTWCPWR
jgi:hypothetical protein